MTRTWTPESEQPKPRTGVDYHTVKAWFQQCRDLATAVEAQKQKIQRIREVAEKTTPSLNGMPGGGGAGDKVGLAATDITDEKRRLQQMETDLCLLRIEATRRAYCITASKSSKKQAARHAVYFVGKVGDFVLFALVLSKDLPCKQKRDILVLHFKVCTFNS